MPALRCHHWREIQISTQNVPWLIQTSCSIALERGGGTAVISMTVVSVGSAQMDRQLLFV